MEEDPEKDPEALLQLKLVFGRAPPIPAQLPAVKARAPVTNDAPASAIWPVKSLPKFTVPRRSTAIDPENVVNVSCMEESDDNLIQKDPSVMEKAVLK